MQHDVDASALIDDELIMHASLSHGSAYGDHPHMTGLGDDRIHQGALQEHRSHLEFQGDIDPQIDIPDGERILIVSRDQSFLTHGVHKFPAKFFPELPRYLIRRLSEPGDVVLDPMCGSGTVVLEALLNNRVGIGLDIDPMARLITKVKTTPIDPALLGKAIRTLVERIDASLECDTAVYKIPEFNYRDKWFKPHVLRELAIINESIESTSQTYRNSMRETSSDLRDFLRVVMSSIIRDVSNADPHCTRTVIRKNLVRNINPGDTISAFLDASKKQTDAMRDLWRVRSSAQRWDVRLPAGDATEIGLDDSTVALAVTSPPYINAVDYTRTHQLEMYWLGLLGESPLSHVKRKYIGTETVYKHEYSDLKETPLATLDPVLKRIYSTDPRRSYIVYRFFREMEEQLAQTHRVLKPGGYYCIAIGNNVIRGVLVRSHEILAEIACQRTGFELERMFFSKLIRHFIRIPRRERMQGEWVLILKRPEE